MVYRNCELWSEKWSDSGVDSFFAVISISFASLCSVIENYKGSPRQILKQQIILGLVSVTKSYTDLHWFLTQRIALHRYMMPTKFEKSITNVEKFRAILIIWSWYMFLNSNSYKLYFRLNKPIKRNSSCLTIERTLSSI